MTINLFANCINEDRLAELSPAELNAVETALSGPFRAWELRDGTGEWEVVDTRGEGSTLMIDTRAECEAYAGRLNAEARS